jgi:hypothetical protein
MLAMISRLTILQVLELSLSAAQHVDHTVGEGREKFVCQWRLATQNSMARIVLQFQENGILLNDAASIAPAAIDQSGLAENAWWTQPCYDFVSGVSPKPHLYCPFNNHKAGVCRICFREHHVAFERGAVVRKPQYLSAFLGREGGKGF